MRRFKEILLDGYYSEITSITDEFIFYEGILSDISCNRVKLKDKIDMFDLVDETRYTMPDEKDS